MGKKKPELLIIDPSIIRPEIEVFKLISELSSIPVSFHLPALEGMHTIWEAEKSADCVGAVILGSAASVRDQRDWQSGLIRWIEDKISPHFPILGICFGHQLLAYMHGSPVLEVGKKHLGFRKVKIMEDKRLNLSQREILLFVAHNDHVVETPKDFEVFASSEDIGIDGLRHKELPIWTFQPHIDATPIFAVNSFYTDETLFPHLKEGNEVLHKFLEVVEKTAASDSE